ncbi:MAG TPA: WecB/TagA/CpsF family glycosyltransferase [Solirubrobacteraceae bacterium]|nr:WecB/TagA/CpsF family glycosyltransferase [Solirubrobacteraceae bacterium]
MTPNLDNLRLLNKDPQMFDAAMTADIRVADGMPLVWASRVQGTPLPARVPGSDLIFSLSRAAADADRSVFLVGGNPGTAEQAGQILTEVSRGLRVIGTYCPPFGFENDDAQLNEIVRRLKTANADFVFLGLPVPKAIPVVQAARKHLPATWFLGLGISFSFVCGEVSRAPRWMQRAGLEWLHRLTQEPRRLGRRYLLEGLPFAVRLLMSSVLHRRTRSS